MAKKCKCPPAGAPEWALTFGDMMSLLLTFFILLAALSEIKSEDVWRAKVDVVQKSFGVHGGGGRIPSPDDPTLSLFAKLQQVYMQQQKRRRANEADDQAIEGREPRVTQVREGMAFGIGQVTFEPGSAELSKEARRALKQVSVWIRGHNNKLELRGHASSRELGENGRYPDLWRLSFARAQAVMDYLVGECGIRGARIRLVANADKEPLRKKQYDSMALTPNRRVELRVSEALVEDFTKPQPDSDN